MDFPLSGFLYQTLQGLLFFFFQKYFNSLDFPLSGYLYQTLQGLLLFIYFFKNILTPWIFHYQGIYIKLFKDYYYYFFQKYFNSLDFPLSGYLYQALQGLLFFFSKIF